MKRVKVIKRSSEGSYSLRKMIEVELSSIEKITGIPAIEIKKLSEQSIRSGKITTAQKQILNAVSDTIKQIYSIDINEEAPEICIIHDVLPPRPVPPKPKPGPKPKIEVRLWNVDDDKLIYKLSGGVYRRRGTLGKRTGLKSAPAIHRRNLKRR